MEVGYEYIHVYDACRLLSIFVYCCRLVLLLFTVFVSLGFLPLSLEILAESDGHGSSAAARC